MKDDNKHLYYLNELSDYKIGHKDPDVKGWDVKDSDNRVIGKVDNLLVNKEQERVVYLDVAVDHSIIEANHDPYGNSGSDVREFINKDGENHIIIPIGLVDLNIDQEFVYTSSVDYQTFAETKRYKSGTNVNRDYEVIVLDSYNRHNRYDNERDNTEDAIIENETVRRSNRFEDSKKDKKYSNTRKREDIDYSDHDNDERLSKERRIEREKENLRRSDKDEYLEEEFVDKRKTDNDKDFNSRNDNYNQDDSRDSDNFTSNDNRSEREKELERELELEKRRRRELERDRDNSTTTIYKTDTESSRDRNQDYDDDSRNEKFRRENDEAYERAKATVGRNHDRESDDDYQDRIKNEQRLSRDNNKDYDDNRDSRYIDKDFYKRKEFEGRNFRRDN